MDVSSSVPAVLMAPSSFPLIRENSSQKWQMFWFGIPRFPLEHIVSVDQFGLWREQLVSSKSSGSELCSAYVQRFASSSVFLSLPTSAMIGVLFSPSKPMDAVRIQLKAIEHVSTEFWTGIFLCVTVFSCISALYVNFTAGVLYPRLVTRTRTFYFDQRLDSTLLSCQ